MQKQSYKVVRRVRETPNTVSIFLVAVGNISLAGFKAGQHLSFDIPRVGERKYVLSAFSIRPSIYRITVVHGDEKCLGRGSSYWAYEVSLGDIIQAYGPSGMFHLPHILERPIVLLSNDIGEAAVAAIAEELAVRAPHHRVIFLHGTYNSSTSALKGKLNSIKADLPNASWCTWFSAPRPHDRMGKDFELIGEINVETLGDLLPKEEFDALICGPESFVDSTAVKFLNLKTNCRRILREGMGSRVNPPIEVDQNERLPPLKPRSVNFLRTRKQATWSPEQGTLLEFAENLGIVAPFSCRTGMCGKCAQRVVSGEVAKIRTTSANAQEHHHLLCSTVPVSDLEVDL